MSLALTRHGKDVLAAILMAGFLVSSSESWAAGAPEYIQGEAPPPDSADEVKEPLVHAFTPPKPPPGLLSGLKARLADRGPFLGGTTLELEPRTYYLGRKNDGVADNEAWALGGKLAIQSGWWRDRIRLSAAGYTTQRLYGPKDKSGTLLLEPGQNGFSVLGQANIEINLGQNIVARLYRQTFNLPYVNAHDTRMIPNTFEAYTVGSFGLESLANLTFVTSHVRQMKTRNSSKFRHMSEVAGFEGTDDGLTMGGVLYTFGDDHHIGAINQYAWNFMNTFYAEGATTLDITPSVPLRLAAQYTNQQSIGNAFAGHFDTAVFGAKLSTSYRDAVVTFAFSSTANNSRIRTPFGGYPGYLSIIVKDFNRAGENAWLVGLSYDFSKWGIAGLSAFTNFASGNTPDGGEDGSPDQWELDITVDYRPPIQALKGLWIRARYAHVNQSGDGAIDIDDYRLIINYSVPFL